jgi:curli biogenesis system outer membrane secretion channel CsgG
VVVPWGKHLALVALAGLAGCTTLPTQQAAPDEAPVIVGPAARRNFTPLEPAFGCLADAMRQKRQPVAGIAVGDVKDYTGKYSQNEGSTITQGGALMIYSALGKLGDVVQLQERFDTRIAELELAYTDRRQLGDGRQHNLEAGKPAVPWVPYFGGSILRSNYYIVGGVTELNYNIASGGFEVAVNSVGAKRRVYTMNIGVDLRLVDTRSLVVVKTVSLQKQITGEEIGAGVYRFFGSDLVDINVGGKSQEPLQLGVRTTIEQGVIELVAALAGVDPQDCIARAITRDNKMVAPAAAAPAAAVPVAANGRNGNGQKVVVNDETQSGLVPQNVAAAAQGGEQLVPFEFGSTAIGPQAMSVIDQMAAEAARGNSVSFHILARDNETWPPVQKRELTNQRIKAATDALTAKGIAPARIGVSWMPNPTDGGIVRQGAGYQRIATLVIAR